jgi:F-type H+-transporting ATPase subunit epsilon
VNEPFFALKVVTPIEVFERKIKAIRLKDQSGFFGVMKGHTDFLTVLERAVCYYTDENSQEVFLALDGGVLSVKGGSVTITTRNAFESSDADKLSQIIENTMLRRDSSEASLLSMLKGIERSFLEKTLNVMRSTA